MAKRPIAERKAVAERLLTDPASASFSTQRIADESGVHWITVKRLRDKLGVPEPDFVQGQDGRTRPSSFPDRVPPNVRLPFEVVADIVELLKGKKGRRAARVLAVLKAKCPQAFRE